MSTIHLNNHPSWQFADDMIALCEQLKKYLGVNYFDYGRTYPDGSMLLLYTDREYVNYFLNDPIYTDRPNIILSPGLHLWNSYIDNNFLSIAKNKFNHDHGITLLRKTNLYDEVFNFATSSNNNKILDLYLNKSGLFYRFIDYFLDEAQELIKKSEKNRIKFNQLDKNTLNNDIQDDYKKFINYLNSTKGYCINISNTTVELTHREAQCLTYLIYGQATKVIARNLGISPRTVEVYFDNLKKKTRCKNRLELISQISDKNSVLAWAL